MPKEPVNSAATASEPRRKFFWGGLVGALLAAGTGLALLYLQFGLGLIHLSYDLPFAFRPSTRPDEVMMVYMDDESHDKLEQPRNEPWSRALHARLLDRLTADGARGVVFDIVFSDPGKDPQTDAELARAMRANGNVTIAADYVPMGYGAGPVAAKQIVPPHPMFSEAVADRIGTAETNPDDDLIIRRHVPMTADDVLPTLSWAAAQMAGAEITREETNRFGLRWLNYYGPPTTISSVSYFRVVSSNAVDVLPGGFFKDKVVFVGARLLTKYAGERKDEFPTPHSRWARHDPFMPGVEIQATAFLNLLRQDWLNRLSSNLEAAIVAAFGMLIGFALVHVRPWGAVGAAMIAALLVSVLAYLSFRHLLIWFPWALLVVQVFVALAWSVVFNSIQLYVQNKLYEASLALYLSPKLVKKFSSNKELLKPGAKKETLTILFSDIANFTTISEGMDSDDLAKQMNAYFQTAVADCIHPTDGTIVKYIGDAIFAFWNAPDPQSDHALRACETALRFRDQPAPLMNNQPLITRIGLHTGVANVGNFGSTARVDYTALGENINLASRMEGLNKYLGTQVLITGETQREVADRLVTRDLGRFRLKGFEKSVQVYELVDRPEKAHASVPLRQAFTDALLHFQRREFHQAEAAFRRALEIQPDDGPSKFYLKQIAELREHPPAEDWKGEIELKEK